MQENKDYIKHCKDEIRAAEDIIKDVNKCEKDGMRGTPLDYVKAHAESDKEIYKTILEEEFH